MIGFTIVYFNYVFIFHVDIVCSSNPLLSLYAQGPAQCWDRYTADVYRTEIEHYSIVFQSFHLNFFFCIQLSYRKRKVSPSLISCLAGIDSFLFNLPFIFQTPSNILSFKMMLNKIVCESAFTS